MGRKIELRRPVSIYYGTSDDNDRRKFAKTSAALILPVPLGLSAFAFSGALGLMFGFLTIFAVLFCIIPLVSNMEKESKDRKIVRESVWCHVKDSLDGRNKDMSLSARLKKDSPSDGYYWESLSPAHIRWIESVHNKTLKSEVKYRAKMKQIAKDHHSVLPALDKIGDPEAYSVKKVKSFLNALDDTLNDNKLHLDHKSIKDHEMDDFNKQMKALEA